MIHQTAPPAPPRSGGRQGLHKHAASYNWNEEKNQKGECGKCCIRDLCRAAEGGSKAPPLQPPGGAGSVGEFGFSSPPHLSPSLQHCRSEAADMRSQEFSQAFKNPQHFITDNHS